MISKHIFRAYDIRGTVPDELNERSVELIGRALGTLSKRKGEPRVLVARDGRLSGPSLAAALMRGVRLSGCDVVDVGVVPTPLLYFATKTMGISSGLMLTGSHNPSHYNGIKSVIAGSTLFGDDVMALYESIIAQNFETGQGALSQQTHLIEDYITRVCSDIVLARPLKIVVDCGNGVAGAVAPLLFKRLGCHVIPLYCDIDGNFPNHHPDPSKADNLQDLIARVLAEKADIGLAFDGDGDRLGVVTGDGNIIWPDRQLILLSQDILARHKGAAIIYDVKCTNNLKKAIEAAGGKAIMSRTGHSYVKATLLETGALLAGEMSGHIFFQERWYGFDDGLYTAARLLEVLTKDARTPSAVFKDVPDSLNTPELQCTISDARKFLFMEALVKNADFDGGKLCTIDGLRVDFQDGWGLVRASNTTPCLVMRFEADNPASLQRIQSAFKSHLLAIDPTLELPYL